MTSLTLPASLKTIPAQPQGMYCNQCQEASKGYACTVVGVCGKPEELSNEMDVLLHALKGVSLYAQALRAEGQTVARSVTMQVVMGLFATITNANWDEAVIIRQITQALKTRDALQNQLGRTLNHHSATFQVGSRAEVLELAPQVGFLATENEDIRSLHSLILFGVKGLAAYYEHAHNLGFHDETIEAFMEEALAVTTQERSVTELVTFTLKTGEYGVKVMALLDQANTSTYGKPEITSVSIGTRGNPGILVSGHDLKDLEDLLRQTEGTGVDVYTHGEMLPAHYYPAFKKYAHFAGNYGGAWWEQNPQLEAFNGPILFTTNCIVPLKAGNTYLNRMYTTGASGYPGAAHIPDRPEGGQKDFSALIEQARGCPAPTQLEEGHIVGGFAHDQVMALADQVVDAVKTGAIKKFFVMAGCDGRFKTRSYYTDFAESLPDDTVILTAGCAKYRYNKLDLGDIGGIPRVLDAGQCNDSYSLAVIALKLKEVFGLDDVNDLPIAYNIAWYEQKAVIVLLALLSLGVKNIHLGPTLPAFLSPNVARVLVENFGIAGMGTVEDDLHTFLA
ncbi:hydroxylamine reductase [Deinococcus fonticola]|uniref:hydroxylamine reductase n=1 Tax=Deinococcus fonticola TaxID=2528713 RepID=UPI00197AAF68|nr:hydroxylamine reductase [Deinococcus fonticola]